MFTCSGNTGEAIATSDEDFSEDEEEEKEAKLLQERQLDRMQEEDFLDTFVIQDNNDKVSSGWLWIRILDQGFEHLSSDLISEKRHDSSTPGYAMIC